MGLRPRNMLNFIELQRFFPGCNYSYDYGGHKAYKSYKYGGHPAPTGRALPNLINAVRMLKSKSKSTQTPRTGLPAPALTA